MSLNECCIHFNHLQKQIRSGGDGKLEEHCFSRTKNDASALKRGWLAIPSERKRPKMTSSFGLRFVVHSTLHPFWQISKDTSARLLIHTPRCRGCYTIGENSLFSFSLYMYNLCLTSWCICTKIRTKTPTFLWQEKPQGHWKLRIHSLISKLLSKKTCAAVNIT